MLTDLSHFYPKRSWIDNYVSLFEQCWQKGNPIQMLNVSDTQTIVSTLNKVYVWGDLHFDDFDPEKPSYESWKNVMQVQLPQGKIHKVQAHNKYVMV